MGTVYLARHSMIDRTAAVKVLRSGMIGDTGLVSRFLNEAKAANAIRHPNIIDIIDVGLLADGRTPYLMMEMLDGENLAMRIRRAGRLRIADAMSIALQTASALIAAHAKGIVHRDLKPENIFLVQDPAAPGGERVKVLDFGIAKLRGTFSGDAVKTQTGALMGTPPYMSPEQCRGVSGEVDHRTDVYALGIMLYEMICGAPPFVAEGFGEILVMHLTRPPEPPRARNPGVPAALERVILKALAKTSEERFSTMTEFRAALAGAPATTLAPGEPDEEPGPLPGSARPTTTFSTTAGELEEDLSEPPRRSRKALVALGAAAVLGLVTAVVLRGGSPAAPAGSAPASASALEQPAQPPPPNPPPAATSPVKPGEPSPAAAAIVPAANPDGGAPAKRPAKRTAKPRTEETMGKW